jgi:hypothetical protein
MISEFNAECEEVLYQGMSSLMPQALQKMLAGFSPRTPGRTIRGKGCEAAEGGDRGGTRRVPTGVADPPARPAFL